jgi:hypothetical protein
VTAASSGRPDHCVAVREQLDVYDWEDDLLERARANHPTVAWWWGARLGDWITVKATKALREATGGGNVKVARSFGAQCYVCDTQITTWARNYPMTLRAKQAVERHKFLHRVEVIPPHSTAGK